MCFGLLVVVAWIDVAANSTHRRWCSVTTEEFELYSYLARERTQELADRLLMLREIAEELVPGTRPKHLKLKIIAFASVTDFVSEFRQERFIGFMHPSLRQHLLVFSTDLRRSNPFEVAFHEFTHYMMRSRFDRYIPLWYEEGFAQYLSTVRFRRDHVIVGTVPARRMQRTIDRNKARWTNILNGKPVLDWNSHEFEEHYDFAWAITHYLNRGVAKDGSLAIKQVPALLDEISRGGTPSEVMLRMLGYNEDEFPDVLKAHFKKRRSHEVKLPLPSLDTVGPPRRWCLNYTEVRALIAETLIKSNPSRAEHLLRQALARSPEVAELYVLRSRLRGAATRQVLDDVKRALSIDAAHVSANLRMGEVLALDCLLQRKEACDKNVDEAIAHYLEALKVEPTRVDAAFGLGILYLYVGRAGDALNYIRVAHQQAPWSARINLYLGDAYRQLGRHAEAVEHLNRAALWEPSPIWRAQATDMLQAMQGN